MMSRSLDLPGPFSQSRTTSMPEILAMFISVEEILQVSSILNNFQILKKSG